MGFPFQRRHRNPMKVNRLNTSQIRNRAMLPMPGKLFGRPHSPDRPFPDWQWHIPCLRHIHTFRTLSTSPQGSLLVNSIPVRGVLVGCSNTEASMVRYSTFSFRFYKIKREGGAYQINGNGSDNI